MSTSHGYSSIPFDNEIAKKAFINQLEELSECVRFQPFLEEIQNTLQSVVKNTNLLEEFISVLPKIFLHLDPDQQISLLYICGAKLCISSEQQIKDKFLSLAEETLQKINNIKYEIENFLSKQTDSINHFALWRLSRITKTCSDYSNIEEIIYCIFMQEKTMYDAAEYLSLMNYDTAKKFIPKALMHPSESVRIAAIHAINTHSIDPSDNLIYPLLLNEQAPRVISAILKLPMKMLNKELIKTFIGIQDCRSLAIQIAFQSDYLLDLLPDLQPYLSSQISGCELNILNLSTFLEKLKEKAPEDQNDSLIEEFIQFISDVFSQSKELILPETIEKLVMFDRTLIKTKIVFPRMGEQSLWRVRYNAILVCQKLLETASEEELVDFASFLIQMSFDPIYYVRKAAFETIEKFPEGEVQKLVINCTIDMARPNAGAFEQQVVRQMLKANRGLIVKHFSKEQIQKAMTMVNYVDPDFFN